MYIFTLFLEYLQGKGAALIRVATHHTTAGMLSQAVPTATVGSDRQLDPGTLSDESHTAPIGGAVVLPRAITVQ